MNAPNLIETARLVLRRPRPDDAHAIYARYAGDPEVTRFLGWPTHLSVDDTLAFLQFSDAEWERWSAGPYLIVARTDQRLLGGTGLSVETPYRAATGYVLARDAWGQGFATEALRAMVDLVARLRLPRLHAFCHPQHAASRRVLEKCGFVCEGTWRRYAEFPNLSPGEPADVLCYANAAESRSPSGYPSGTTTSRLNEGAGVRGGDRDGAVLMTRRLISSGSSFEHEIGYSRAVVDGDWIFVSGTTGFDYRTMTIAEGIVAQTEQCFRNIAGGVAPGRGLTRRCRPRHVHRARRPRVLEVLADSPGALRRDAAGGHDDRRGTGRSAHGYRNSGDGAAAAGGGTRGIPLRPRAEPGTFPSRRESL